MNAGLSTILSRDDRDARNVRVLCEYCAYVYACPTRALRAKIATIIERYLSAVELCHRDLRVFEVATQHRLVNGEFVEGRSRPCSRGGGCPQPRLPRRGSLAGDAS